VQVNFNDYHSDFYGKIPGLRYRYQIKGSKDGKIWTTLVDRSHSFKDTPNDYVELAIPKTVRYIRYKNIAVPTPYLSISGIRVFGEGSGNTPQKVTGFKVHRHRDRRNATISWAKQK